MVILRFAEIDPAELLAQTVYCTAVVCKTVGVPQIVPLLLPKFKPEGRLGLISQDVGLPPVVVASLAVMERPFVRVIFSVSYAKDVGVVSTLIEIDVDDDPAVLLPHIV